MPSIPTYQYLPGLWTARPAPPHGYVGSRQKMSGDRWARQQNEQVERKSRPAKRLTCMHMSKQLKRHYLGKCHAGFTETKRAACIMVLPLHVHLHSYSKEKKESKWSRKLAHNQDQIAGGMVQMRAKILAAGRSHN